MGWLYIFLCVLTLFCSMKQCVMMMMMMMNEAMEKNSEYVESDDQKFELPPGFRFHPTDEELITHYLSQKVLDTCFSSRAIGEADLNKCEPWDLPWKAKMGENEWYFFCMRDRKYPTGLRTNRATSAGYWKATGKDKEIYRGKILIGMKKTLVFYKGRAPKGEKTNWVMHEYRLEDNNSIHNLSKKTMNEWSICRVFEKGYCGKKIDIPLNSYGKELPPLMDDSPYNSETKTTIGETSHVTCFSDQNNLIEEQKTQQQYEEDIIVDSFETQKIIGTTSSYSSWNFSPASWNFSPQVLGNSFSSDSFMVQEQSMLKMLIENNESSTKYKNQKAMENDFDVDNSSVFYNNEMFQRSFGNNHFSSASLGHVDNDFLWNF